MTSRGEAECTCGNKNYVCYGRYVYRDVLLGVHCDKCGTEWLLSQYVSDPAAEELQFGGHSLKKKEKAVGPIAPLLMVKEERTHITNVDYVADYLKPSDHIGWRKAKKFGKLIPYWHHAIVTEVGDRFIEVIHFAKDKTDGKLRIIRQSLPVEGINAENNLYRFDYDEDELKMNPFKLVLGRAESKLYAEDYSLLSKNCESFATFCKIGIYESQQMTYLKKQVAGVVVNLVGRPAAKTLFEVFVGEAVEHRLEESNLVGAGFVVLFEGVWCCVDLTKMYKIRRAGGMSRSDFVSEAVARVAEALFSSVSIAGLGIVGQVAGNAVIPVVGGLVGAVIFGVLGGAFAKFVVNGWTIGS